jgi:hypothetical protein
MHPAFVPGDNVTEEFVDFTSQQQLSVKAYSLLFQFLSEHLGNASRAQISGPEISK